MEAGVHLPQIPFGSATVRECAAAAGALAEAARDLGFVALCANDHFTFSRPWIDGLTLLASVADRAGELDLMTTVALPALRGPVPYAAAMTALASIARGRVIAGVGPGSSTADHALVGADWSRRWTNFEESVIALRTLLAGEEDPDRPTAVLTSVPPVRLWLASWGSPAGMRRVASYADGWLASAYHSTPEQFGAARTQLEAVRDTATPFDHALVTMWTYVTEDRAAAQRMLDEVLAPALGTTPQALRGRVCVGSAGECADLLSAYGAQGCRRVHFWPIADEVEQLARLASDVLPRV